MFFDDLNDPLQVDGLDSILMNRKHKYDVLFLKNMMTAGNTSEFERLSFEKSPYIIKRRIIRTPL
jgi:hypothetical protein